MNIITISGETGALRSELAREICERGGLELVDRRTLMEAVQGLVEISREEHQLLAEQGPAMLDMGNRRRRVFAALLESVVLGYCQKGDVVLVGRGANFLLRLVPGALMVRTVAPLELRAQRLANREGLELDRARQLATVVDQQRRAYIAHVFGADWASPLAYDLVLNLGRMSLGQAVLTTLDLASHTEYQVSSETQRVLADMVLAARVRRRLVEEVDVHALQVEAVGDRVSMSGYLGSSEELKRTLRLAEEVEGVGRVESALEVSPMLMKFMP
jgi:cytidylate kinase